MRALPEDGTHGFFVALFERGDDAAVAAEKNRRRLEKRKRGRKRKHEAA